MLGLIGICAVAGLVNDLKRLSDKHAEEIAGINAAIEALEGADAEIDAAVLANAAAIAVNIGDIAAAFTEIENNLDSISDLQDVTVSHAADLLSLDSRLSVTEGDINALQIDLAAEVDARIADITTLEGVDDDLSAEIYALQADLALLDGVLARLDSLDVALVAINAELDDLDSQVSQNVLDIADQLVLIVQNSDGISVNSADLIALNDVVADVISDVDANTGAIAANLANIALNTSSIQANDVELATLQGQIIALQAIAASVLRADNLSEVSNEAELRAVCLALPRDLCGRVYTIKLTADISCAAPVFVTSVRNGKIVLDLSGFALTSSGLVFQDCDNVRVTPGTIANAPASVAVTFVSVGIISLDDGVHFELASGTSTGCRVETSIIRVGAVSYNNGYRIFEILDRSIAVIASVHKVAAGTPAVNYAVVDESTVVYDYTADGFTEDEPLAGPVQVISGSWTPAVANMTVAVNSPSALQTALVTVEKNRIRDITATLTSDVTLGGPLTVENIEGTIDIDLNGFTLTIPWDVATSRGLLFDGCGAVKIHNGNIVYTDCEVNAKPLHIKGGDSQIYDIGFAVTGDIKAHNVFVTRGHLMLSYCTFNGGYSAYGMTDCSMVYGTELSTDTNPVDYGGWARSSVGWVRNSAGLSCNIAQVYEENGAKLW
jgi:hypothetical protein